MRNDWVPAPAPPRPGLAAQDARAAGSRDRAAAASRECAASARPLEAKADGGGPIALRLALSSVSVGVQRDDDCPTGDRYAHGVALLLQMVADRELAFREAMAAASRAIELDGTNALGYALRGMVVLLGGQVDRFPDGLADARRAHEMNP